MKGDTIPSTDHIVRYCSKKHLMDMPGGVLRVAGFGFEVRAQDHGRLSCHWLECFEGTAEQRIQCIRDVSRLTLRKSGRFAKVNVGKLIYAVREQVSNNLELQVISDPLDAEGDFPADPTHSVIANFPENDQAACRMVGSVIADIVSELFSATFP